ncbi:MAG: DUF362 domain-containing protein [Acidobacteria bacterium]|nr:DUF362 domain-containing protein [Acidobacteriota bacterium]
MADQEHSQVESLYRRIGRRDLLRLWGRPGLTALALGALGASLVGRAGRHRLSAPSQVPPPPDWRVQTDPALAAAAGNGPAANLHRAVGALGGIARFIRKGETVLVKPNCGWDRMPEQAANTNPELVAEIVRMCLAAGARRVTVADNTCQDPVRCFRRSGIGQAARQAGARVVHQGIGGAASLDLGGTVLGVWSVLKVLAEADRVINVPIVKQHSLAVATLGMKNWLGVLLGSRARLHQRIHQSVAELGAALRPTLTVVDATRILTAGGPTGGSLSLVRKADAVAVSTDPVAADAWGAEQLRLSPMALPYLAVAERLGLGTPNWRSVSRKA